MHVHTLEKWRHSHDFSVQNEKGEQRTQYVLILTAATMVVEIVAGGVYGSMALLADGWHMGTHVVAFMIALLRIGMREGMLTTLHMHSVQEKLTFWVGSPVP